MFSICIVKNLLIAAFACVPLRDSLEITVHQAFRHVSGNNWEFVGATQLTVVRQFGYDKNTETWQVIIKSINQHSGISNYEKISFSEAVGAVMDFSYSIWMTSPFFNFSGGGLSFDIIDAIKNISGTSMDGGLGYGGGRLSYPEIRFYSLDNSTSPAGCATSGGTKPLNRIFVQGSQSEGNSDMVNTMAPVLNDPNAAAHAVQCSAGVILTPAGHAVSPFHVGIQDDPADVPVPAITNQPFAFAVPVQLRSGLAGSSGAAAQFHVPQLNKAAAAADIQIENTMTSPTMRRHRDTVSYLLKIKNNVIPLSTLSATIDSPSSAPLIDDRMAELTDKTWTCAASGVGTTCPAVSGSGDISNLGNYTLGQEGELTFIFQGQVDGAATCGASIGNTATVDFTGNAGFSDQDLSNNSASSAAFNVDCSPGITPATSIPPLSYWEAALLALALFGCRAMAQRRLRLR